MRGSTLCFLCLAVAAMRLFYIFIKKKRKQTPSCIKNELHYGEVHPANILIPHTATVGGHLFWEAADVATGLEYHLSPAGRGTN